MSVKSPPSWPRKQDILRGLLTRPAAALFPLLRLVARKKRAEVFDPVEFLLFCFVGVANTLVDLIVFFLASSVVTLYAARIISWAAACAFSYLVNRRWVFLSASRGAGTLLRFVTVNLCGLGLGIALLLGLHEHLGWNKVPAYLASVPVTMLVNYFGYKLWSFKEIK